MSNQSSISTLSGVEAEIKQSRQKSFMRNMLHRYPVVSFFVLAYAIAWSGDIAEASLRLSWLLTLLLKAGQRQIGASAQVAFGNLTLFAQVSVPVPSSTLLVLLVRCERSCATVEGE